MSPYWGKGFFSFFVTLYERLSGQIHGGLASDEIQLIMLAGLSVTAAVLGTFLILKRMTMLANALSHTLLIGIACAFFITCSQDLFHLTTSALLIGALIAALLTAFCVHLLERYTNLSKDASIGMVFSLLFALGITLVTLYLKSSHIGIEAVMGNLDAIHKDDLMPMGILSGVTIMTLITTYPFLKVFAFDRSYAHSVGIRVTLLDKLLLLLLAVLSMAAFRSIGVFLFLSLLTAPPLCALKRHRSLPKVLITASAIAFGASLVAVALSRALFSTCHISISTASLMVILLGIAYAICSFFPIDSAKQDRVPS